MDWAQRRRISYALGGALFLVLLAAYPIYQATHVAPTCSDGKQNGDEVGVDCGGSQCAFYCSSQVVPPRVVWAQAFPVSKGYYDVGVYIENANTNAGVKNARYTITIFDAGGKLLAERDGSTEIAPASTALVFEGGFSLPVEPDKVEFEFNKTDLAHFAKARVSPSVLTTKNQILRNPDIKPRFDATLVNTDLVNDVGQVTLGAIIYDAARHPVAVSSTVIEGIAKGKEQNIFFTWPNRFTKNPRGGMCATPVDTMLVFDRSGSMDMGHKNPPEPLNTAREAALAYVNAVGSVDKVGLVSFATTQSDPIDQELSVNHDAVRSAVSNIAIGKGSLQETDLGDALKAAFKEFTTVRHGRESKPVIVLLTDGEANRPFDPVKPSNKTYPEEYAVREADAVRSAGVGLYAIGLGSSINETFLRDRIATDPTYYFNAPSPDDLRGIYKHIAENVCSNENFITEIVITPQAVFGQ